MMKTLDMGNITDDEIEHLIASRAVLVEAIKTMLRERQYLDMDGDRLRRRIERLLKLAKGA